MTGTQLSASERARPEVARAVRIMFAFARVHPEPFFIQVGANDGIESDPLAPYVRSFAWRGVMVEPVPYIFEQLRANVPDPERIELENAAIADSDGHRPFYTVTEPDPSTPEPPWFTNGVGSFDRDFLLKQRSWFPDIESRIVCLEVPCMSFDTLCAKHRVTELDLLVIDVEGYDAKIVQSIDFSAWHPRLVIFEHHHLTSVDREGCNALLRAHGYELMTLGWDTWCLDPRTDDALTATWREPAEQANSMSG